MATALDEEAFYAFTLEEMARLSVYRRAVQARYFSDTLLLGWLTGIPEREP